MIRRLPDITNIEEAIGYKPTKNLIEMIEAIIAYDKIHSI
jgi:nucleoside-diphosphate-sugar epimerase